jgi:hypothetical protein
VVLKKGDTCNGESSLRGTAALPLQSWALVPSGDGLTDSLERRHEGRAFIQHGQNRVSGLGRKHQDDPINAGVTVAF